MTTILTAEFITLAKEFLMKIAQTPLAADDLLSGPSAWRMVISALALRAIDNHQAIRMLASNDLPKPAAALLRNTTEAWLQIAYLDKYPEEIRSWTTHQLSQIYKAIEDSEQHDTQTGNEQESQNQDFRLLAEKIPGYAYQQPRHPWVPIATLFDKVFLEGERKTDEEEVKRMRRHLYHVPSMYVHAGLTGKPDTIYLLGDSNFTTLLTVDTAIEICRTKNLLQPADEELAKELAGTIQSIAKEVDVGNDS